MKNFEIKVMVDCEESVMIEVNEKSVVEIFSDGGCRGEYWENEGWEMKGIREIKSEVKNINEVMEMGEDGVWWIKVDGEVVYERDFEEWKEDKMEMVSREGYEYNKEIVRMLKKMKRDDWLDLEYVGCVSMGLSDF